VWRRAVAARLADDGYAAPAWPKECGGMDLPLEHQLVYQEEVVGAHIPAHPTTQVWIVGPTLIRHGTDEQRKRFVRPMLRADELWCQGFSEPNAGSDLAAISTRAERHGDEYVVSGQKIWTSNGHIADWMFGLVRTGTARHEGVSYLLIDMKTPGITVVPIKEMAGGSQFSQVFLDEVRVPVANLVGDENGGWAIARTSLGHERSTAYVAQAARYERVVRELQELSKQRGLTSDPLVRQHLADIEIRRRLIEMNGRRVLSEILATGEPGPGASVNRLFYAEFEQRLHEVAVNLLGMAAVLDSRSPDAVERGRWTWGFLRTRGSTIGTGTSEVQRNVVAERALGLPRDI
jgi:alkylation response protein AidB-like acyl-CoA dehydrogenase